MVVNCSLSHIVFLSIPIFHEFAFMVAKVYRIFFMETVVA